MAVPAGAQAHHPRGIIALRHAAQIIRALRPPGQFLQRLVLRQPSLRCRIAIPSGVPIPVQGLFPAATDQIAALIAHREVALSDGVSALRRMKSLHEIGRGTRQRQFIQHIIGREVHFRPAIFGGMGCRAENATARRHQEYSQ